MGRGEKKGQGKIGPHTNDLANKKGKKFHSHK